MGCFDDRAYTDHTDHTNHTGNIAMRDYFLAEKAKYLTSRTTALDCMVQALAAKAAVNEFISRQHSPLELRVASKGSMTPMASSGAAGMRPMR